MIAADLDTYWLQHGYRCMYCKKIDFRITPEKFEKLITFAYQRGKDRHK